MKTLNAVIKEATIKTNDSNIGLKPLILLKFNSFETYFGYDYNRHHNLDHFINNILKITEKRKWEDVTNTNIRVKIEENGEIVSLGHIIDDSIWFSPNIDLNYNNENTKVINYPYIVNSKDSKHFFIGFNYDLEYIDIFSEHELPLQMAVKVILYIDKESNVYYAIDPRYTYKHIVIYTLSDLVDKVKNILLKMLDDKEKYIEEVQCNELLINRIVEKIDDELK